MTDLDGTLFTKADEITQNRFRYTNKENGVIQELIRLSSLREYEALLSGRHIAPAVLADKLEKKALRSGEKSESFDLVGKKIKLPSLPIIFTQIVSLMGNPNSSANDFADVIRVDLSLVARLLKLVNSSFYGLRHRIDTVSNAVSVVGTKALYSLVLSMSVIKTFKDIPEDFVDLPSFWSHSIACGIIAKRIAEYLKMSEAERFFVAGLLHDIGRLIIYNYLPFRASEAFAISFENDEPLYQSEARILEHDHGRFGGLLLKFWKLPDTLVDMVMFHHIPAKSRYEKEASIIHLSDIITHGMRFGTSGERFVPDLSDDAWRLIEIPIASFEKFFQVIGQEVAEITNIITPKHQ